MPTQPFNQFKQTAINAVELLGDVRDGLMARGWTEAEASEAASKWYTDWSAYQQALVTTNINGVVGIAEGMIGLAGKGG